ncbi:MAG: HD domain-containing phosphohydrolase [Planctomycetota bacterium]|nr:HD domain-containing phosphohydrolase [Planctomycetota bacterium]
MSAIPAQGELEKTGGHGRPVTSGRAGFLPIPLARAPRGALEGIPVFVRNLRDGEAESPEPTDQAAINASEFRLYCAAEVPFTEEHRNRLLSNGVRVLYIRMADHAKFRKQTEAHLDAIAGDPTIAEAEKSAIVYETSVELINELLTDMDSLVESPQVSLISRSVATLVLENEHAFGHLLAASHHDFYTATHMVNVATWMAPLAYELGHTDPDELAEICKAGIVHDMGKLLVPDDVLNKPGKLSDEDWAHIRRHPEAGYEYLQKYEGLDEMVLRVTREHHERLDGKGYPHGLTKDQIHPVSRICAVVDSFDAMTAFRPYKERTLSVQQTLDILKSETPEKYDPDVMAAWLRLIEGAGAAGLIPETATENPTIPKTVAPDERRAHPRKSFFAPARIDPVGQGVVDIIPATTHNLSRSGIALLARAPMEPGEQCRVTIDAKGWRDRPLKSVVVRCRAHNDEWYEIGMHFLAV